ncbi:SDR family oxidoreductase [Paenibacillus abyssi]|uniref:Short-chain dehydrogenase/reductase n=1 Tax=Paenibacillus abyssi TaxID=1340531 RepID=A0A917CRK4_9BACL|nr:SDR family oxidoreductase [Paenibacillus abyssi]GGF95498.1 short-chain dehydrogenase/reductase [Paenibacillus abyssi]
MKPRPIAMITGASSGFGLQTAIALAKNGFIVAATMRDTQKRDKLLATAVEADVTDLIHCLKLDVTDHEAVRTVVQSIIEAHGTIDVLVNNAGMAVGGFVEDVTMEEWRRQMETNLFGVVAVTQAVLPFMRKRKKGLIINISSLSGRVGFPGYAPYAASKYALEGLSEALRHEMLPHGVKVVLVEPGAYRTEIWQKGFDSIPLHPSSPYYEQLSSVLAYSRKAAATAPDPQEVAETIVRIANHPAPKLRYPMGRGARLSLWSKALLPWRTFERVIAKLLHNKKAPN